MARKRMIDPGFWIDEKLGTCTRDERLLFMGLISNADDEGRLQGHPALLKSIIFPYDADILLPDIEKWVQLLSDKKIIQVYQVDGQTFIYITNFLKHQTIKKPTASKLPAPPREPVTQELPTGSPLVVPNRKEEKGKEEKGKESGEPLPTTQKLDNLIALYKQKCPNNIKKYGLVSAVSKARDNFEAALNENISYVSLYDTLQQLTRELPPWEIVNIANKSAQRDRAPTEDELVMAEVIQEAG